MTFTVDMHHHMLPDFFWQATNEGDHPVGGVAPAPWSRATAAETFRRLYWDTAASWGDPVLRDVAGIDRVLFGTDYPYMPRDLAVSGRDHIEASRELTDSERAAVFGATATALIPRLAALRPQTQTRAS